MNEEWKEALIAGAVVFLGVFTVLAVLGMTGLWP